MWFSVRLFARLTQASIALVRGPIPLDLFHQLPQHSPQSQRPDVAETRTFEALSVYLAETRTVEYWQMA